jgi:EmrB/QacA subfamily drug resistance transporter
MEYRKSPNNGMLLVSLAVGTFMSALDTSAVTVAVSSIQNDFSVSLASVEWIITAYLLVISATLLTFGRLADIRGHRKVYIAGFAAFTASSLLCGLSSGIAGLIVSRVLQALGAAMMFSSNSAIITANVPAERRGKAFGMLAIAVASACCIGPVAGGFLVSAFGWRSIFFINVPIGIAGTALALVHIPRDKKRDRQHFDFVGASLAGAALFLVLLPLDLSASSGFPISVFVAMLACGAALIYCFIQWERRTASPILKLDLFKNRVFSASLAACTFNFTAQFMMAFLAPWYFQKIRQVSPAMTGLLYLPMPLTTIFVAPLSGSFSDRHDSRIISSAGMAVMAVALLLLSFLDTTTPCWFIVFAMALAGAGSGMFQSPNNSAVMGCAPAEHRGVASGTLATMRNIGMVLGVALSGAIFNAWAASSTTTTASQTSVYSFGVAGATRGLHAAFIVAALAALAAMLASLVKGSTRPIGQKQQISKNS